MWDYSCQLELDSAKRNRSSNARCLNTFSFICLVLQNTWVQFRAVMISNQCHRTLSIFMLAMICVYLRLCSLEISSDCRRLTGRVLGRYNSRVMRKAGPSKGRSWTAKMFAIDDSVNPTRVLELGYSYPKWRYSSGVPITLLWPSPSLGRSLERSLPSPFPWRAGAVTLSEQFP